MAIKNCGSVVRSTPKILETISKFGLKSYFNDYFNIVIDITHISCQNKGSNTVVSKFGTSSHLFLTPHLSMNKVTINH